MSVQTLRLDVKWCYVSFCPIRCVKFGHFVNDFWSYEKRNTHLMLYPETVYKRWTYQVCEYFEASKFHFNHITPFRK